MKIYFDNWFYRKADSDRMWAFNTPSIQFTKIGTFLSVSISILFWQLTIETK